MQRTRCGCPVASGEVLEFFMGELNFVELTFPCINLPA